VHNNSSTPIFSHSIVQNSGGSGSWNSSTGTDSGGNIDSDPIFTTGIAPSLAPTTAGNYQLQNGVLSPALNQGNSAIVTALTDLAGNPRIDGGTVDIGAYEADGCVQSVVFVDHQATGGNIGINWSNAFTDLQAGINSAKNINCGLGTIEVWVADGIYTPGNTVSHTFTLTDRVAIYGGFAATETIRSQRDFVNNLTILSGDIGGDDTYQLGNGIVISAVHQVGNNSYNVVTANGVATTAVLDGFTITAGQADHPTETNFPQRSGGGLYAKLGSPTLTNIDFYGNSTVGLSGGAHFVDSQATLTNVIFSGNRGDLAAGGLGCTQASLITLNNATFSDNEAGGGAGGLMPAAGCKLSGNRVTVSNNRVTNPSAVWGGGIMVFQYGTLTLTNAIVADNHSTTGGGGIFVQDSLVTLVNVTLADNGTNASSGGGIYLTGSSAVTTTNSIVWGNTAVGQPNTAANNLSYVGLSTHIVSHSLLEGSGGSGSWNGFMGTDGGNNLDANPNFVSAANNWRLQPNSVAINAGNSAANSQPTDLAGMSRVTGTAIDLGAYEWFPHAWQATLTGNSTAMITYNAGGMYTLYTGPAPYGSFTPADSDGSHPTSTTTPTYWQVWSDGASQGTFGIFSFSLTPGN